LSLEGETGRVQHLVLGIGVNVGQRAEDFSPEVAEMATSLSIALGRSVSRPALAAAEIRALDRLYARLLAGDLTADLEAY
ncbi:biotin--[acetyl-CoA-carboxylase] ligase, partial [Klebsiella oxytoca]